MARGRRAGRGPRPARRGARLARARPTSALLWDYESFWAQDLEFRPSEGARHRERVDAYYDRLWRDGHTVDLARPSQDLSGYRLVVAPASYLLTAAGRGEPHGVRRRRRHAAGQLLQRHRRRARRRAPGRPHGSVARRARRAGRGVPAAARRRVAHRDLRAGAAGAGAATTDTTELTGTVWADDLVLDGAEPVGSYVDGPKPGGAALTRHRHGAGTGWYVSTSLDVEALATVMTDVYASAGLAPSGTVEGLEVVRRTGEDADYTVAINHTDGEVKLPLGAPATDLLTGDAFAGSADVPAGAVRVLRTTTR